MLYLTFTLQIIIMLGFPVGLWLLLRKRLGASWGLIGAGVLTFIASQVVHLPLNWALGLLGGGRGVALWPLPWMALVAGLSAGVCEEGARYLVLRFWRREARSWGQGVAFGAGHGGAEALILGLVVTINFVAMIVLRAMGLDVLHLSGDELAQVQAQIHNFWNISWYLPLLGGLERVSAITIQIGASLLVMRSLTSRNPVWFLAAVGFHTLVDGAAVLMSGSGWSAPAMEGVVFLFALGGLALILALRSSPWSRPDSDQPYPVQST